MDGLREENRDFPAPTHLSDMECLSAECRVHFLFLHYEDRS